MNSNVRLAPVAGILLTVVLTACQGPAANGPSAAAPTVAPTTAAGASAPAVSQGQKTPPTIPDGPLTPGTYTIEKSNGITVDIPPGWSGCCQGVITKSDFAGLYTENLTQAIVYDDACKWGSGQSEPRGAKAIADALAKQRLRDGARLEDVTIGGLPAAHVRLTVPADQKVSPTDAQTFVGCDQGQFRSWSTASDSVRYHQGPGQIDDLYVVDVYSSTFVFDVISGPDIAASDATDLSAMISSIRFHPPE